MAVGVQHEEDEERLRDVSRLIFASKLDHERVLVPTGPTDSLEACVHSIVDGRFLDLGKALLSGARQLVEEGRVNASGRLLVWVGPGMMLTTEPLLEAIDLLSEVRAGVELVCTDPIADMRLLTQIANLAGGEFIHPDSRGGLQASIARRLGVLRNQRLSSVRLRLKFEPLVKPVCFFSVKPNPMVIRELRLNENDEHADIELGPVDASGGPLEYLLTALVPRRPKGDFPLVTLQMKVPDVAEVWSLSIVQPGMPEHQSRRSVDGVVSSARERVEAALIIEEMAHAYTREDGGRIALLLDSLVRYYTLLGLEKPVKDLAQMKLEFLRGGLWGRANLNAIRRLASQYQSPDWP